MIEVQIRDENGKDRIVATFACLEDLVRIGEQDLAMFGHCETQRTYAPHVWQRQDRDQFVGASRYCYVAIENGKIITPDRLVGLCRKVIKQPRHKRRHFGWGRYVYGGYRKVKTTNERRQLQAHNQDDFVPPIRPSRNNNGLPSGWDDIITHSDKSWKTQSKRRHQWK